MAAMASCPVCHADNPHGARFCATCGNALAPLQSREVRKTITVLFADVTGSTALGEQLDPETMRSIMAHYFTMMKAVIEHHGGTVEKFIGDAVMAVFGIPQVHEDDALRAVRAAAAIKTELARLNTELEESRGIAIRFRTGVNTGEVVAGDPATGQTLVTGDTVNVAARLEQHAPPGEILLGAVTWSLVRDAVEVEPVEPIAAKGKAAPVPAWRLLSVKPGEAGRRRRLDTPLVGRERELGRLEQAFRQAVADGAPGLFTLLGSAGVGKSRLVAEFVSSLAGQATVLRGHCLSYGEGITYWPIGEIVRGAAGIDEADTAEAARAKVRAILGGERDGDVLAARISSAIGLSPEAAPQEEIFWAIRKLLELLASERRLVVVVEDIHWAEPTLLDLLEHIVDWSRDAPLLILCTARPELLDGRPGWGGGKLNATTALLEALAADATGRLIAALPGGQALPEAVVGRIAAAAEGNPLYLEEMLAMLVDDGRLVEAGDGTWQVTGDLGTVPVPASISALLAARLEQLAPAERAVAERASVVGRVFEAAAVSELSDDALRPAVSASLLALVRKELVRPERSELTAGDAFRFRHILIRDAAYAALPKADRAALHERFADWLEQTAGERLPELEEIVGHHLEQAHRYRTELGESGPVLERLGERAVAHLWPVATEVLEWGDPRRALGMLQRVESMMPRNAVTLTDLFLDIHGAHRRLGHREEASAAIGRAEASFRGAQDSAPAHRLALVVAHAAMDRPGSGQVEAYRQASHAAITAAERMGDDLLLSRAQLSLASAEALLGRLTASRDILLRRAELDRRLGRLASCAVDLSGVANMLPVGPWPVDESLRRCTALLEETDGYPDAQATILLAAGALEMFRGDLTTGRRHFAEVKQIADELGVVVPLAAADWPLAVGLTELLVGEPHLAIDPLRWAIPVLRTAGDLGHLASLAPLAGQVLAAVGELEEAEDMTELGRSLAAEEDLDAQIRWRLAQSTTRLARGRAADAVDLLAEARHRLMGSEFHLLQFEVELTATAAGRQLGDRDMVENGRRRAIELAEAKGSPALRQRAAQA
jgi:class 3 adenylate cyclase